MIEDDKREARKAAIKRGEDPPPEFSFSELSVPSEEYRLKANCLNLAGDDARLAVEYYNNWSYADVYEWLAIRAVNHYKPQ